MTQTHHDRHTDADAMQGGAKFTPGPWHFEDPLGPEILSIVAGGPEAYDWKHVAQISTTDQTDEFDDEIVIPPEEAMANARLIAAAPDLFAALRDITDRAENFAHSHAMIANGKGHVEGRELRYSVDRARAALALATRREPSDA